ncbi:MAG: DedA family protein [Candidatus Pacearchaeota archaeon]
MNPGIINFIWNFFMEIDKNLLPLIGTYGNLVYFFLFIIIFLETGLVITPFLPGDSLIFAVGTAAGAKALNVLVLFVILCLAAILGDTFNYYIGKYLGLKFFEKKLVSREYFYKTKSFYEKHGGKTIILARFIPLIRTFAPFVAGAGKMKYSKFLFYNIIGGILWVSLFLFAGYFFGNIPFVQKNFTLTILFIIFLSLIPILIGVVKNIIRKNR